MLGKKRHSPGYHTTVPDGEWVHPTRESLTYALALFQSGKPERVQRARTIVVNVISLQDKDPESKTYGIWSWLLEEPLSEMAPPDWNWADFCGAPIAQMLIDHADLLPPELSEEMRTTLLHAARSIVRRNVGPGYTNIAIMGAGVTAAAGEVLGEQDLVGYARDRMRRIVEHYHHHGGFNEYNSPTYTMVALHECERVLHLVKDAECREYAETLRRACWQTIARHYHPGTGQWAGPHSRSYDTWLPKHRADYIAKATGISVDVHPKASKSLGAWSILLPTVPCPSELVERFRGLPEPEVTVRNRVIRREPDEHSTYITTWLTPDVCLGSVNHDTFWTQRQVVKAYWNGDDGVPVMLRLRFLHDGVDFASACVHAAQDRNRVLAAVSLLTNQGDFHPSLDRPKDGVFEAGDFRVRCELVGADATGKALGEDRFELGTGSQRCVLHTIPAQFGPHQVTWVTGEEEGNAFVDGVCYTGEKRPFRMAEVGDVCIAFGLEILSGEASHSDAKIVLDRGGEGTFEAKWSVSDALTVKAPLRAHK
jgi:hypothetical protein